MIREWPPEVSSAAEGDRRKLEFSLEEQVGRDEVEAGKQGADDGNHIEAFEGGGF